MANSIPDRWTNYKPIGKLIKGTRFIAFKVPLREHVSNKVDKELRLDGSILMKAIPNLGLIIDLTNTDRYYDPDFFIREGVDYFKLKVPGHDTPSKDFSKKFNSCVKSFIKNNENNDKLIGVHCTHGVNRTGFFICNYMISQMAIEPNQAMNRFARARGHKIERVNYIGALQKLLQNTTSYEHKAAPSNYRGRQLTDNKIVHVEHKDQPSNWRDRRDQLPSFRQSYVPDNRYVYRRDNHIEGRSTDNYYNQPPRNNSNEMNQVPLRFDHYNTRFETRQRNRNLQHNTFNNF